MKNVEITIVNALGAIKYGGYGEVGIRLARHLSRLPHVKVNVVPLDADVTGVPDDIRNLFVKDKDFDLSSTFSVMVGIPSDPYGMMDSAITMHEGEVLNFDWIDDMNSLRGVLFVPSKWNKLAFESNGVMTPIHVLHFGLDVETSIYYHSIRSKSLRDREVFTFLAIDKDNEQVIQAFLQAFPDNSKNVKLVSKLRTLDRERHKDLSSRYSHKRILHVCEDWSTQDWMSYLASKVDVLVHPPRNAGWSLPITEALGIGIPCITTYHTALTEYLSRDHLIVANHVRNDWHHSTGKGSYLAGFQYGVDIDDLARKIRDTYSNYEFECDKANAAMNYLHRYYNWDISALQLADIARLYTGKVENSDDW